MPTLATGITRSGDGGFTLIELVIVLVIVSISLGLILPNFSEDDAHRLHREAEDTVLALESAADLSNATGKLLSWHVLSGSSQFEVLNASGQWEPWGGDDLKPRVLPTQFHWDRVLGQGVTDDRYVFVPGEPAPVIRIILAGQHVHQTLQLDALAHGAILND